MTLGEWFERQLQAGADLLLWAVDQMPEARRHIAPPRRPDDWPVARHVFHLVYYERHIAAPSLRQWLGGPPVTDEGLDEDAAWKAEGDTPAVDAFISSLLELRAEQIALVKRIEDAAAWEQPREAVWGTVTPRWIVTKTLQHTAEHTHDVLRMALWWGGRPNVELP
jgi:hypothetical protein